MLKLSGIPGGHTVKVNIVADLADFSRDNMDRAYFALASLPPYMFESLMKQKTPKVNRGAETDCYCFYCKAGKPCPLAPVFKKKNWEPHNPEDTGATVKLFDPQDKQDRFWGGRSAELKERSFGKVSISVGTDMR